MTIMVTVVKLEVVLLSETVGLRLTRICLMASMTLTLSIGSSSRDARCHLEVIGGFVSIVFNLSPLHFPFSAFVSAISHYFVYVSTRACPVSEIHLLVLFFYPLLGALDAYKKKEVHCLVPALLFLFLSAFPFLASCIICSFFLVYPNCLIFAAFTFTVNS